jgi:hypothetical protein
MTESFSPTTPERDTPLSAGEELLRHLRPVAQWYGTDGWRELKIEAELTLVNEVTGNVVTFRAEAAFWEALVALLRNRYDTDPATIAQFFIVLAGNLEPDCPLEPVLTAVAGCFDPRYREWRPATLPGAREL